MASLAHHFNRRADVYNRGYGGYNSRWARPVFESLFPPHGSLAGEAAKSQKRHFLVTIWLGANDAAIPSERAYVPVEVRPSSDPNPNSALL